MPMTGGFSAVESVSRLSQSKTEDVKCSDTHAFHVLMPLCHSGELPYTLQTQLRCVYTHSSWV